MKTEPQGIVAQHQEISQLFHQHPRIPEGNQQGCEGEKLFEERIAEAL
jgi:hypothetical protein